jgi:hypothetical protein
VRLVDQAHVGFMNEARGIQAVTGSMAPKLSARDALKVVVDEWHQPAERVGFAGAVRDQQPGDVGTHVA